jgi:fatty-acyl-CoA synthase
VLDQRGIGYLMLADLDDPDTGPLPAPVPVGEDDTALLQLTSGASAAPKAVRITHGSLYANMTAMVQAAGLDPAGDVLVSWLPLFHDMGMVGFLTVPMALGLELVKVTPADFLSRPLLWPELISRHRGTVTAAPNFAYALLARRMAGTDEHFDLSTLRFALNGAEPIEPAAVRAFTTAGARFGLPEHCMVCAYGMAETVLGVSFAPHGIGMQVDTVDADALEARRRAIPVPPERHVRAFPRLGPPLSGLEVQVVAEDGRALAEREVGRIRLRGESVTREYLTVEGARPAQDPDGWLDTGDEGYLAAAQGRHHHGRAQHLSHRHRARRRAGRRGPPGQRGGGAPRCRCAAGVVRGGRRVPPGGRHRRRAHPAQGGHLAGGRRGRPAAGCRGGAAAGRTAQDTVGQIAPCRGPGPDRRVPAVLTARAAALV